MRLLGRRKTTWEDLYAPDGKRAGVRCESRYKGLQYTQCCLPKGHDGDTHRYTSGADGRSVTWTD